MSSDINSGNSVRVLSVYFESLKTENYGSGVSVKIPFFGGCIELEMEFNNGMIDLLSATSNVMGESSKCLDFSLGYTDSLGVSRSTSAAIKRLVEDVEPIVVKK